MELQFTISSEQNVREAFAIWAWENGYEILESGEECPDLRVRKPDGEIEGFEVEKLASNFRDHGHDPDDADRIVCWRNDLGTDAPLPVIQLETHIDASDSLHTPRYVLSETGGGDPDWINQFLVWEEDGTPYLTFRYYGEDDGSWQLKSSAVPNLSGEEFASIFGQIPVDIRREAFCNASFQTLRGGCHRKLRTACLPNSSQDSRARWKARISRGEFEEDCLFEPVSTGYKYGDGRYVNSVTLAVGPVVSLLTVVKHELLEILKKIRAFIDDLLHA